MLSVFAIMHQKEDNNVWHASVRDFCWFETKQCLRSAPSTPVMARFSKKPPSFAAPKARRPPPIFVQQRAGLGSNYEIEHFPDPGSLEEQKQIPAPPPVSVPSMSLYPQHVQTTMTREALYTYQPNVYRSQKSGPSEPPPIKDWPRPIDAQRSKGSSASKARLREDSTSTTRTTAKGKAPMTPQQVQAELSRASTKTSSRSGSSHRPPPPVPACSSSSA